MCNPIYSGPFVPNQGCVNSWDCVLPRASALQRHPAFVGAWKDDTGSAVWCPKICNPQRHCIKNVTLRLENDVCFGASSYRYALIRGKVICILVLSFKFKALLMLLNDASPGFLGQWFLMCGINKLSGPGLCYILLASWIVHAVPYSMKKVFCLLLPSKCHVITEHSEKFTQTWLHH